MALAENPFSPSLPLLHGWWHAHRSTSTTSAWVRGPSASNCPSLSPVPRIWTSRWLNAGPASSVPLARPYGLNSTIVGRGASGPSPVIVVWSETPSSAVKRTSWLTGAALAPAVQEAQKASASAHANSRDLNGTPAMGACYLGE